MSELSTLLTTLGRNHEGFGSVNAPVYRASTILFEDFDSFSDAYYGRNPVNYGRQGNPLITELSSALGTLIGAERTILTSSGLLAITISLLAYVKAGDAIFIPDSVYGPTRAFACNVLAKMQVDVQFYDPEITPMALEALLNEHPHASVLYMEAPGSLTFEMQDIAGLCEVAKRHGCVTMLDYTWASPLYIKPFALGVDIAIQAVTKYVAGHSDVVMGAISCAQSHYDVLHKTSYQLGNYVNGDECFLALRGLRTMQLRLQQQVAHTHEVMAWLEVQPEVRAILTPMHASHAGHALWKAQMQSGCSLFAVRFCEGITRDQVAQLCNTLHYFGMGFSWGGFESLIVPFKPAEIRTATKHNWDTSEWCIRLHIGLEHPSDLVADLEHGFAAMRSVKNAIPHKSVGKR
jgi:cysteine-S-conjugate beta-lyase